MLKWLAKKVFGNTYYFEVTYGNEGVKLQVTILELIELFEHCNKNGSYEQIKGINKMEKIKELLK